MQDLKEFKKVMFFAAEEAGKVLVENFDTDYSISRKKEYTDLVTEIDRKSESRIIEVVHDYFPNHNVLSEECGNLSLDSEFIWIVDPIDGTINYTHSLPIFCISIALEINKKVVLGIVYNPMSGEKFFSELGHGSYLNENRISVSSTKYLKDSLLVTGFPYDAKDNADYCIDHFVNFVKCGLPIRRLGSAAIDICYVACGKFDSFWEVSLNPWDVAAGYLILKEAGGKITNFNGSEYSIYGKQILASNGKIHQEMIEVLKKGAIPNR